MLKIIIGCLFLFFTSGTSGALPTREADRIQPFTPCINHAPANRFPVSGREQNKADQSKLRSFLALSGDLPLSVSCITPQTRLWKTGSLGGRERTEGSGEGVELKYGGALLTLDYRARCFITPAPVKMGAVYKAYKLVNRPKAHM